MLLHRQRKPDRRALATTFRFDPGIALMQPGDFFHLGGLLRGYVAPYSVVSGTPCHLLRLPRQSFEPFMLQRSWLIKAILKHSRLSAEQQILHPEARNLWAADRYFDMKKSK